MTAVNGFHDERDTLLPNVLVTSPGMPGILQPGGRGYEMDSPFIDWPSWRADADPKQSFRDRTPEGEVIEALASGWSGPVEQVLRASEFSTDEKPLAGRVSTNAPARTAKAEVRVMAIVFDASAPLLPKFSGGRLNSAAPATVPYMSAQMVESWPPGPSPGLNQLGRVGPGWPSRLCSDQIASRLGRVCRPEHLL